MSALPARTFDARVPHSAPAAPRVGVSSIGGRPVDRGLPLLVVDRVTPVALARVAEVLATRVDFWRRLVRAGGRRWSTRVAGGGGWEAWLVAWPGGDRGEPDSGGGGAVVLLAGELVLAGGPVPGCGARGWHRLVPGVALVLNDGAEPVLWNPAGHLAVSLHVVPVLPARVLPARVLSACVLPARDAGQVPVRARGARWDR